MSAKPLTNYVCIMCDQIHEAGPTCPRPSELAPAQCSAATCQWETVSPVEICGKPAEYEDASGKKLCKRHGEYIKNRWPESVTKLMPPNDQAHARRDNEQDNHGH